MILGSGQEAWAHRSQYVNKDNPDKVLSTKEWKALPKEERGNYIKTESTKDVVERVSYAKVWGETAKDKSEDDYEKPTHACLYIIMSGHS